MMFLLKQGYMWGRIHKWGRRGRDRMVHSWIYNYLCNQCRHDITEILLKVALNTITFTPSESMNTLLFYNLTRLHVRSNS